MRNAVQVIPLKVTATPSAEDRVGERRRGHRDRVDEPDDEQRAPLADPRDQRAGGQRGEQLPMPSRATTRAAVLTSAPSSRARSARTGITAPCPMALTTEGPYAASAMSRKRKSPRGRHRPIVAGTGSTAPADRRISSGM